jgi:hypothetical protein
VLLVVELELLDRRGLGCCAVDGVNVLSFDKSGTSVPHRRQRSWTGRVLRFMSSREAT